MSWPTRVLTEPVTILSAPREEDEYGRDMADWDNAEAEHALARLQPTSGTGEDETLINRDQQRADLFAYLPPGTHIAGRDRVVVETTGETFEVIGPPLRRRSAWSNAEHHVRASLRRVDGL